MAMSRTRILPDQVANQIVGGEGCPALREAAIAGCQMTTRPPIHDLD